MVKELNLSSVPEPLCRTPEEFRKFADQNHGEQEYDGKRYVVHLDHAAEVAKRFGNSDPEILMACYGHDLIEDTKLTAQDIYDFCKNPRVVELICAVTDESGKNRKEKKKKTYPKTRAIPDAVFVKLCDRIANAEACVAAQNKFLDMYQKEQKEFEEALRLPGEFDGMWSHLNKILS